MTCKHLSIEFICLFLWVVLLLSLSLVSTPLWAVQNDDQSKFPLLKADYLSDDPPGMTAELFAPGILSTELHDDRAPYFSPDGNMVIIRIAGDPHSAHFWMRRHEGIWSKPEPLPFLQEGAGFGFRADGKRAYFSKRKTSPDSLIKGDYDLWYIDWDGESWGALTNLGANVNSDSDEIGGGVANDGTIYFSSNRPGGYGERDIYSTREINNEYSIAINLGSTVNSEKGEVSPSVSPDGRTIVFTAVRYVGASSPISLFVTFQEDTGTWTRPMFIDEINDTLADKFSGFSPDGRFLFWVGERDNKYANPERCWDIPGIRMPTVNFPGGDIYWIDSRVLERYRTSTQSGF